MIYFILIITLLGPLWVLMSGQINFHLDYRTANRESAHLAPSPKDSPEAIIQVYSARAFNWRGIFSVHTWMAVKQKNANQYRVYQVIGWRIYRGLPVLMNEPEIPDRNWFGQKPEVILDIRGERAEKLIPRIAEAVEAYPEPNIYKLWPGPNSNTFTAFIARSVPELGLELPSSAIGKDYLFGRSFFAPAPSGTGYQFSLFGVLGIMLAKDEGLEVNLFGAVFGINFKHLGIKLPGIGLIGLK